MIQIILEGLKLTEHNSENIHIAKGKYKLPTSVKGAYKKFKREIKWQK